MALFDVTDAEWALIEPFLPVAATGPPPTRARARARAQINEVLCRFRDNGWRDVPERYRPARRADVARLEPGKPDSAGPGAG